MFQLPTAKRRIKTSRGGPNTMQISQVGHPEDTKRTRTEEEQEEQSKKHQNTERCHIVVPYNKGLCESYKSMCSKYGVQAYFKGGTH